jgi:betaine-aldehyde dehydrogenase
MTTTAKPNTEVKHYQMFIGGEWRDAASGETLDSVNPATEEVIATIPNAGDADIDLAVRAAKEGFAEWQSLPPMRRVQIMREMSGRMAQNAELIGRLDTLDSGNPIRTMLNEARVAPGSFANNADPSSHLAGRHFHTPANMVKVTHREPYGVAAKIIPFNHPYIFAAGVSALIGTGNAAILKPSEATSLTALELARMADGLFPAGMLNVITGLGHTAGSAIVRHPGIPRIDFTGSVPTGKAIMREAADNLKRLSLELGGKNPLIVFPDVEVENATVACSRGMNLSTTMGQSCQSNSRVFVHDAIFDRFLDHLVQGIEALKVGDPLEEDTDMGPMAFEGHYNRVMSYIESGKQEGARLVTGGGRPPHMTKGYYVQPTVFADVDMNMRIAREEIFGPVISVLRWTDYEEMMQQANDVDYGLAAHIWCKDIDMANRAARDVQAGIVYVNGEGGLGSPVPGYKNSSHGAVGDVASYTQEKCVQITLH